MCRNFGVIRFKTRHSKCRTGFIALQVFSEMFQHTQLRIVGYTAILVIHTTNVFYMNWHTKGVHTKDERVLVFKGLDNRFLTTWNFMLQTAYAIFGLLCDVYVLKNSRKQLCSLPSYIAELREIMFSAIVWPSTWLVFTVFWGLYNYDRSLIFPEYLDPFLPRVSNHVIHTLIAPIVLFEIISRPRIEPSTHLKNLIITSLYICSYLLVMLLTYKERNVWLYPVFGLLYGSVYFVLLVIGIYGLAIGFYMVQWPISRMICLKGTKKNRQIQKRKKRV
ncbi:unnamed protein product [Arctia plantaginis]|uniref:Androgen-dependent TFPI-regulating protein n=1 Tax=Arctia plantaginis TaxID=874455 RepID=A0A8S1BI47_ARCPL|nr:unnamed protein product [Arctia plantaginis]